MFRKFNSKYSLSAFDLSPQNAFQDHYKINWNSNRLSSCEYDIDGRSADLNNERSYTQKRLTKLSRIDPDNVHYKDLPLDVRILDDLDDFDIDEDW